MKIGITCYPTYGGSGAVATELGIALAGRGHEVHFITYKQPFRLPSFLPRIYFHEVDVGRYPLFEYPPYDLALAVNQLNQSAGNVGVTVKPAAPVTTFEGVATGADIRDLTQRMAQGAVPPEYDAALVMMSGTGQVQAMIGGGIPRMLETRLYIDALRGGL